MKRTKLVTLLKTFSEKEMKDFEKFITSPYFSSGRNLKPLFNVVKKYYPSFDSRGFTEEKIIIKLYPGKKYEKKKSLHLLRVQVSDMTALAVKFLEHVGSNSGIMQKFRSVNFLKTLNERTLDNFYIKYSQAAQKSLGNEIDSDSNLFILMMGWEKEMCVYNITHERESETTNNLVRQGEYLIFYFLIEFSKVMGRLQTNINVFNADISINLVQEVMKKIDFEKILSFLKINSFKYYPIAALYYYSLMSHLYISSNEYYRKFKALLEANLDKFSPGERHNLYSELENCCWKRLNSSSLSHESYRFFWKELMGIYKKVLNERLYLSDEYRYLRVNQFRNIMNVALTLKEYNWVEKFVKNYVDELAPEQVDNMYNYSFAVINFERGNFEKSLGYASKIKYEYFYFRVDIKILQLKIFYELNLPEQAISLIDTYKHFLRKNKNLSADFRRLDEKFLYYYVKILKIKNGDYSFSIKNLMSEVSEISHFGQQNWIKRKIEELFKK